MDHQKVYLEARQHAEQGRMQEAEAIYGRLARAALDRDLKALVYNDLGCLAQLRQDGNAARMNFERALEWNEDCEPARQNLARLPVEATQTQNSTFPTKSSDRKTRVAILSFLFNWPSTGGGIIHTVELGTFLRRAGYEVELLYPRYSPWGIGRSGDCPFAGRPIDFQDSAWTIPAIQQRFREAVDELAPDYVVITDSWNIKPYLAEAVRGYPYILRLQAMECLCPLNNLRLLPDGPGVRQCPNHQLADPDACLKCLAEHARSSGSLHRMERRLCRVGTPEYRRLLYKAFADAEVVLTLNRQTADLLTPYTPNPQVVTWGMDPARFSQSDSPLSERSSGKTVLLFAGLVRESIKGYAVLEEACRQLWRTRRDFELVVTGEPDSDAEFVRGIGWQTQEDLTQVYRDADVVVVPSIAQEGLSRTAVEAMASARPVIGSRMGGLAELIEDGVTGLFATPGESRDLAQQIETLLDSPDLRRKIGERARKRFERDFSWPTVIERDYRPLLARRRGPEEGLGENAANASEPKTSPAKSRRLEIGPGQHPLPGFETIDLVGEPTYRARWGFDDLTCVVNPRSYEEVYASHVLEHVPWNRTLKALKDVFQILKPGGVFEVWVPNFEYIVECYQRRICGDNWRRDNPTGDPMLWVNGRIFTYGPETENFHFACFDYDHLSIYLSRAGFVEIERLAERTRGTGHGPIDLGVRCMRPETDSEGHL